MMSSCSIRRIMVRQTRHPSRYRSIGLLYTKQLSSMVSCCHQNQDILKQHTHTKNIINNFKSIALIIRNKSSMKSNDSNNDEIKGSRIKEYTRPISITQDMKIIDEIPLEDVRNFCFIAHVDHGKSSLASRVLELTGNLGPEQQWTAIEHANLTSMYNMKATTATNAEKMKNSEKKNKLSC